LFCCLLNRLGYNYYRDEQGDQKCNRFVVKMIKEGKALIRPDELVQGLLDSGHTLVAGSKQHITSFGIGLCVKEEDGSWSSIPLGMFFQTGYADESGKEVHTSMPHGGMELNISGPLVGTDENGNSNKCSLANFMAIDGMAGWHSNEYVDAKWLDYVQAGKEHRNEAVLDVVRMEGLLSTVLNATGTELDLPFGGYGLTGVCNDSAALLDQALEGGDQSVSSCGDRQIHDPCHSPLQKDARPPERSRRLHKRNEGYSETCSGRQRDGVRFDFNSASPQERGTANKTQHAKRSSFFTAR